MKSSFFYIIPSFRSWASIFRLGQSFSGHVGRGEKCRPLVSDTSPKSIDREGLGESRTGTTQDH